MDRARMIKDILNIDQKDYVRGVAQTEVDIDTVEELLDAELIEMEAALDGAPTVKEFVSFMKQNQEKGAAVILRVIDPERKDFRIEIVGVGIDVEYAQLDTNNIHSIEFWKEWMAFGKKGDCYIDETDEKVFWRWN